MTREMPDIIKKMIIDRLNMCIATQSMPEELSICNFRIKDIVQKHHQHQQKQKQKQKQKQNGVLTVCRNIHDTVVCSSLKLTDYPT